MAKFDWRAAKTWATNRRNTVGTVVALAVLAIVAQNCDNVRLNVLPIVQSQVSPSAKAALQPVLAVRKTACIMCHAQIDGDLVTDFGYGDPFFLGTDDAANHPTQTDYSPFTSKQFVGAGQTWSGSSVMGNIYVPEATITDQRVLESYSNILTGNPPPPNGALKLLAFVTSRFVDASVNITSSVELIPRSTSVDITQPGLRGQFMSRQSILIDAPSDDEIKNLELTPSVQRVSVQGDVVVYKNAATDSIAGFGISQSQNTGKTILTNTGNVVCRGDIIIEGTVFLNNLQLDTDAGGCRLYVAGSVFIQGGITYINGGDSNLQISSSRAIIMGMRDLNTRFTDKGALYTLSGLRRAPTEAMETAFYQNIMAERDSVDGLINDAGPFQIMMDSSLTQVLAIQSSFDNDTWTAGPGQSSFPDPSTCVIGTPRASDPCAINWTGGFTQGLRMRKTVNFTHLLLNAPTVQSRYLGNFQGVVIAEDALFAVNQFSFSKDPVFTRTALLPLLKDRVFKISDQ